MVFYLVMVKATKVSISCNHRLDHTCGSIVQVKVRYLSFLMWCSNYALLHLIINHSNARTRNQHFSFLILKYFPTFLTLTQLPLIL